MEEIMIENLGEIKELIHTYPWFMRETIKKDASINPEIPIKNVTQWELARFAMYIATADDGVTLNKVNVMNQLFDFDFSLSEIQSYIKEKQITDGKYNRIIPVSFKLMLLELHKQYEIGTEMGGVYDTISFVYKSIAETIFKASVSDCKQGKIYMAHYLEFLKEATNKEIEI